MIQRRTVSSNDSRGNQCILVVRAIVSSIETLLGPDKSLKCIQSDGTSFITSSTSKVLEHVDVQHPVGFIINDACQNFQKHFGCGCTSMVCLIGYWATTMQDLVEMGIPVQVISNLMDEALETVEEFCKRSCITLKSHELCTTYDPVRHSLHATVQPLDKNCSLVEGNDAGNESKIGSRNSCENFRNNEKFMSWHIDGDADVFNKKSDDGRGVLEDHILGVKAESRPTGQLINDCQLEKDLRSCSNAGNLFLETCPSSGEACRSDPPKRKTVVDEFEDCFDEMPTEPGALDMSKTQSTSRKTSLRSHHNINVVAAENLIKTPGSLFPNNVFSKDFLLSNSKGKTNMSKVRIRSRHFVGMQDATPSEHHDVTLQCTGLVKDKKYLPAKSGLVTSNQRGTSDHGTTSDLPHAFTTPVLICNTPGRAALDISGRNAFFAQLRNLAHGTDKEMNFALEMFKNQISCNYRAERYSLSVDHIAVESIIGPPISESRVLNGVVVPLTGRNRVILNSDSNRRRSLMLVNGDITFGYTHSGFQAPITVKRIFEKSDDFTEFSTSEQQSWIEKVRGLVVERLHIGLIVARGTVGNDLRDCLQSSGVIVVGNVKYHRLEMLSKMTNTPIMCYPCDMELHDLGEPVVIRESLNGHVSTCHKEADEKWPNRIATTFAQVCLDDEETTTTTTSDIERCAIQTLLVCGPVSDLNTESELNFWNCIHRLRNALDDNRVLPGGGEIERRCIEHLDEIKSATTDPLSTGLYSFCSWTTEDYVVFKPLVYDALIKGLREYISRVEANAGRSPHAGFKSDKSCVFDNYTPKIEGWKRAVRIVKLLLSCEYNIITGI